MPQTANAIVRFLHMFHVLPIDAHKIPCNPMQTQATYRFGQRRCERQEFECNGMDRFVSTFTNKIDAKGRVSVPASFRAVLERDGYMQGSAQGGGGGIYCYPSLDAPALDAGGQSLARKIDGLLDGLPDYSDERDELSVALYGDVHILSIDQDGRIVLPEPLRAHAGLSAKRHFRGAGKQIPDVGARPLRGAAAARPRESPGSPQVIRRGDPPRSGG